MLLIALLRKIYMSNLSVMTVRPNTPLRIFARLLLCIRFDEVCILQATPVIGACFAMANLSFTNLLRLITLVAGSFFLVAHVFVLNDWSGIKGDLKNSKRAKWTFFCKGLSVAQMGYLMLGLLTAGLLLFLAISPRALLLSIQIAGLSALYSTQIIHGKGIPLLNSLLHLIGGTLHFLLGYGSFAPISIQAVAIGCYFGLVFTAGHLIHEARDYDADSLNGIRTNAVAFGKRKCFFASVLFFSAAYALLTVMALSNQVPLLLAFFVSFYPLHLLACWRALQVGLTFESLRRLQMRYRWLQAIIGIGILVAATPW